MKKYIPVLIFVLCLLLPKTSAKYVLSSEASIKISTLSFDMLEEAKPLYEIEVPNYEYIEVKVTNNTKTEAKGSLLLNNNKLKVAYS